MHLPSNLTGEAYEWVSWQLACHLQPQPLSHLPEEKNLQEPANVADMIIYAAMVPPESVLQEVIITPLTETSWP